MMETSPTTSPGTAPAGSGTNRGRWLKPCDSAHCANVFIGQHSVHFGVTDQIPTISLTHEEWAEFLTAAKRGDFDL